MSVYDEGPVHLSMMSALRFLLSESSLVRRADPAAAATELVPVAPLLGSTSGILKI